jgi:tripartite-type tricarboxylate transporter receptor subunit TctC
VQGVETTQPAARVLAGMLRMYGVSHPTTICCSRASCSCRTPATRGYGPADACGSCGQGIFAPAGTDARIVQKIGTDVARIFQEPENVARLDAIGLGLFIATPETFKVSYDAEYAKWAKVIKAAGIRAE